MNKRLAIIFLFPFLMCIIGLNAQTKLNYWKDIDGFLQEQAKLTFDQAHKVLDKYPPAIEIPEERILALYAIDCLLHDTRLDQGKAFKDYMVQMLNRTKSAYNKSNPQETKIIKFYNHGFIIQESGVTIGIDLVKGGTNEKPYITNEQIKPIIDLCDIMLVTHAHRDHADQEVAKMFVEQHKNVIVPSGLWTGLSSYIKEVREEKVISENINIPQANKSIKITIFPGHQDEMLNNVYVITTPKGVNIMHTGDQSNKSDVSWMTTIGDKVKVDVLLAHCWMSPMNEIVLGVNPSVVISGHENEMGHTIDHREPFWLTFRRLKDISSPYVIMAWGELYVFNPSM